jgi:hypothetical protein
MHLSSEKFRSVGANFFSVSRSKTIAAKQYQFLWNTSDIYTCTTNAPFASFRRWHNIVKPSTVLSSELVRDCKKIEAAYIATLAPLDPNSLAHATPAEPPPITITSTDYIHKIYCEIRHTHKNSLSKKKKKTHFYCTIIELTSIFAINISVQSPLI